MNANYEPAFPVVDQAGRHWYGLSARAYAAIHLRQPISNVPWLDDAIRAARREAIATALMGAGGYEANGAAADADALIAKLEGGK